VVWSGYPWWYWIATGAGLGVATYTIGQRGWWGPAIAAVIPVGLVYVAYAAGRARGVCAGWVRGAMRICAALDQVREIEFGALLTLLDISKSALSKHVSVLVDAGYVAQRRAVRDPRQRVWLRLTETGRSAYRGHVAALHRIVGNGPG
jgi:DNA-binding transcriptional ArsR family regulator